MIRSIPRSFLAGLCLWPVLSLGQSTVAFETAANGSNAPEVHAFREMKLSPGAAEVARLIGVAPLLERLQHLSKTEEEGAGSNLSPEALDIEAADYRSGAEKSCTRDEPGKDDPECAKVTPPR